MKQCIVLMHQENVFKSHNIIKLSHKHLDRKEVETDTLTHWHMNL